MRARNIKPGFYGDKALLRCSVEAALLFPGLWMLADREGRLLDDPEQVEIDTYFLVRQIPVEPLLQELAAAGLITRYDVGGVKLILVNNFLRHQNPHKNEKLSELPEPPHLQQSEIRNQESENQQERSPHYASPRVISGEAQSSAETSPPPLISIPLRDGSEYPVTMEAVEECQRLYPRINVELALRKMSGYWEAQPQSERKAPRGIKTSINSWLAKDSEKASTNQGGPAGDNPYREFDNG